jgi:hypothetical protein
MGLFLSKNERISIKMQASEKISAGHWSRSFSPWADPTGFRVIAMGGRGGGERSGGSGMLSNDVTALFQTASKEGEREKSLVWSRGGDFDSTTVLLIGVREDADELDGTVREVPWELKLITEAPEELELPATDELSKERLPSVDLPRRWLKNDLEELGAGRSADNGLVDLWFSGAP